MAGVAGLPETSNINGCDAREASKHPAKAPANPGRCRTSQPVRYELIDKDGKVWSTFVSPVMAAAIAHEMWPDQQQDPDRTGRGWDVEVACVNK